MTSLMAEARVTSFEDFIYLYLDDISRTLEAWSTSRVRNLIIQPWFMEGVGVAVFDMRDTGCKEGGEGVEKGLDKGNIEAMFIY